MRSNAVTESRPWIVVASALLALAAGPGCRRESPPPPQEPDEQIVPVAAVPAERAGIRAVVRASGVVTPAEGGEFLARAPEPARIIEVLKNEGEPVQGGEVLVRFELPSAAQELARVRADLAASEALLENARINQSRMRDFVTRGLVPRRDGENADREVADAEAAVDRLARALAAATAAADRAVVRAPFDGVVATRWHAPGDMVTSAEDPVLRVVDPRRLDVTASVASGDAARVVPGATARISAASERAAVALHVAGPVPGSSVDDPRFRLLFAKPADLAVDTRVELEIDAEERADAVLIPSVALIPNGPEQVVMVADGRRAERRVVQIGIADNGRTEVTSGLQAGELVIIRGHIGLEDGAAITVAVGTQ
jgi:membrane fusion protein, multidrug efflux system